LTQVELKNIFLGWLSQASQLDLNKFAFLFVKVSSWFDGLLLMANKMEQKHERVWLSEGRVPILRRELNSSRVANKH
jgi:hypothetical protein